MMSYMNKVLLKGRLGQDPALRFMPSGDPVCNFSLATKSGSHVEWHKVVCYKWLAEHADKTFRTGDVVYVEAEIKTREFLTEDDKKHGRKPRKVVELVASEAHLVAKRDAAGTESDLPPSPPASQAEPPSEAAKPLPTPDPAPAGLPKYV